jgi:hypothetical protein
MSAANPNWSAILDISTFIESSVSAADPGWDVKLVPIFSENIQPSSVPVVGWTSEE